jgi:hypothetical protein
MKRVFFERLHPDSITSDMLSLIEESKKWDEDQTATEEILGLLAEGCAQLWYFNRGTDHAIMVTQVIEDKQELHVFIWRLFGKGLLPVYPYVEEKLMSFARSQGALTLQTETHQKGEEALCARGFHKDAEVLVKEVSYGQKN